MQSVLRKVARLGGPVSAKVLKFLYFIIDGGWWTTESCRICGFPISHRGNKNTYWADAEVLNLVNRHYYVFPICKHCRETKTWNEIYKAYSDYWADLYSWTKCIGFTWSDIELALLKDRKENIVPGEIKFWEDTIRRAYKSSTLRESEFCGFRKGEELRELVIAAKNLEKKNKGISVVETETRTSIRFKKNGKK